jgi:hypothetical protein
MIWLVGNRGMLESEIAEKLDKIGVPWFGTDREADITSFPAIHGFATRSIS